MAEGKVNFELVSPERLLMTEDVDMVVVPGSEGYFGVLPGHAPLISTLRPGVIDVYQGQAIETRIFVADGFAEVTPERCTVLAGEAVLLGEVDRAEAERRVGEAELDLRDASSDEERAKAQARVNVARALVEALR